MNEIKLILGDNMESLKKLPDNCIDSVVSDPPYGLNFMNKKWDYQVPTVEFWKEVYRVLKPGGHVLSFGGTRTYHRMVVNCEDAGFEVRDCISWLYGSGFPKSLNVGKSYDKLKGNEREKYVGNGTQPNMTGKGLMVTANEIVGRERQPIKHSKGTSQYEGFGSALKPAQELILMARKPLSEKSITENYIKWGVGGINVDGCRVETDDDTSRGLVKPSVNIGAFSNQPNMKQIGSMDNKYELGRFPANIILECICDEVIKGESGEIIESNGSRDNCELSHELGYKDIIRTNRTDKGDIHTNPECPCYILDKQSGVSKSPNQYEHNKLGHKDSYIGGELKKSITSKEFGDKGGASRFFYQAKVSKKERNMGLVDMKSSHPTVKPINLLTYLCRLVTPTNGIILDPFMGSGSTGIAARLEGFRFVGMEMDPDYFKIAEARINSYLEYKKLLK